jgi:hypothetical protein
VLYNDDKARAAAALHRINAPQQQPLAVCAVQLNTHMQKGEITREEVTCVLSAVQHLTAGDQLQLRNDNRQINSRYVLGSASTYWGIILLRD